MICCEHDFKVSPFFVLMAVTSEEPTYYPPGGMARLEMCSKCGAVRLPTVYHGFAGMEYGQQREIKRQMEEVVAMGMPSSNISGSNSVQERMGVEGKS